MVSKCVYYPKNSPLIPSRRIPLSLQHLHIPCWNCIARSIATRTRAQRIFQSWQCEMQNEAAAHMAIEVRLTIRSILSICFSARFIIEYKKRTSHFLENLTKLHFSFEFLDSCWVSVSKCYLLPVRYKLLELAHFFANKCQRLTETNIVRVYAAHPVAQNLTRTSYTPYTYSES